MPSHSQTYCSENPQVPLPQALSTSSLMLQPPYKYKGRAPKSKGLSFFAFLFSIFVYISIFYTFNLSPSALLNNTKFWFFISNTLILIIAVDYGTSTEKRDLYEEYVMHNQARNGPSFVSKYEEIVIKKSNIPKEDLAENLPKELDEDVMKGTDDKAHEQKKIIESKDIRIRRCRSDKIIELKDIRRCKSDKAMHKAHNENKKVLRRSETERVESSFKDSELWSIVETHKQEPRREEDEFSTMSDEELNRRIEDFIQRLKGKFHNIPNYD